MSTHFFFFCHPVYYPRTILALPPRIDSDPGSHIEPVSPLPTAAHAFIFLSREEISMFSSLVDSRVELCLPTLLGALSS